ncbi:putative uncharacterized protein DDB_G0277003 isoform X1 [Dioscorea cayenensis subsp. rotundata]|uniref:FAM86 N-terminal domain-containing protein n=2 Tax=Dioscorea cayennensis subsp. rotundata TaxID=55577 RepID=A0AB40AJ63_DIOCR|nr:putative uncharacterized protein DDB_G0277003 isoform X1 [Dioscorea cayenensis subsp. rotundata]
MDRSFLYLKSALLAMEPVNTVLFLARQSGGGSITTKVQTFILDHCADDVVSKGNTRHKIYMKNILKSIISVAESSNIDMADGLYEQFAYYMTLNVDDGSLNDNNKICKHISFYLSNGHGDINSTNFIVKLQCSLNMLQGDTGCALWPSGLLLSEFILSQPGTFSNKCCLEVGSGVGLVGVCLAYAGASKVVLTDGDVSTLANMEHNLELNEYITKNKIECKHLLWETASESELQSFQTEIVLGADIVYDPRYVPHLIRVLSILLNHGKSGLYEEKVSIKYENELSHYKEQKDISANALKEAPVAYIATVIRNDSTWNYFLRLAGETNISVQDITGMSKSLNLLPYMPSYDRESVYLFKLSSLCN